MTGPLSKHAWIIGFTEYLETKERCRLPDLRKPREGAYFNCTKGNFQHRHFSYLGRDQPVEDWGEAFVPTPEKLNAPWIWRAIRTTDDIGPCDDIDRGGCSHRHAAAKSTGRLKPKSLTKFDETGLMCITCRPGTGIRCLNLYGGEDRGSTLRLVQSISDSLPADGKIFLLYDIACKFYPYLNEQIPDWSSV